MSPTQPLQTYETTRRVRSAKLKQRVTACRKPYQTSHNATVMRSATEQTNHMTLLVWETPAHMNGNDNPPLTDEVARDGGLAKRIRKDLKTNEGFQRNSNHARIEKVTVSTGRYPLAHE